MVNDVQFDLESVLDALAGRAVHLVGDKGVGGADECDDGNQSDGFHFILNI